MSFKFLGIWSCPGDVTASAKKMAAIQGMATSTLVETRTPVTHTSSDDPTPRPSLPGLLVSNDVIFRNCRLGRLGHPSYSA